MKDFCRLFPAILAFLVIGARAEERPSAVPATNGSRLKELVGRQATVAGKVAKAEVSGSGMHFLNFEGGAFKAVTPKDSLAKFPNGGPASLYDGKSVEVTGQIELYKGAPQMKLLKPEQIKIATGTAPAPPPPGESAYTGKLTPAGRDAWVSPIGLRFQGRDPDGLTRVEHIMRHAKDQPRRPGSHGVFEGGGNQDKVFALIDEAWDRAQKNRLRPSQEGGRSSYTVPMGRRVGFLGGMEGARRRNPALQRVFIVFETGTKNIVTAFPK